MSAARAARPRRGAALAELGRNEASRVEFSGPAADCSQTFFPLPRIFYSEDFFSDA